MHDRLIAPTIRRALARGPAVRLSGPRASGKTTTCVQVVRDLGGSVIRLDDRGERALVSADPAGYVRDLPRPVLVDEYHHVPEMLDVVKADLSRAQPGSVGEWLLCGSVSVSVVTAAAESLGGRLVDLDMGTLTVGERRDWPSSLWLGAVLEDLEHVRGWRPSERLGRNDLLDEAMRGGFPLIIDRSLEARRERHDAWVRSSVLIDAASLGGVRDTEALRTLLGRYSTVTAGIRPKDAPTADVLGLARQTIERYRSLLDELHVTWTLPAIVPGNARGQVTRSPKIHVVDSGLAAHLAGRDTLESLQRDPVATGALVETMVVNDIRVLAACHDDPIRLHHYRESRHEVDLVIERGDGRLVGVEVKLAGSVNRDDLRGLRRLAESAGDRYAHGVVLARVSTAVMLDEVLVAPIDSAWRFLG